LWSSVRFSFSHLFGLEPLSGPIFWWFYFDRSFLLGGGCWRSGVVFSFVCGSSLGGGPPEGWSSGLSMLARIFFACVSSGGTGIFFFVPPSGCEWKGVCVFCQYVRAMALSCFFSIHPGRRCCFAPLVSGRRSMWRVTRLVFLACPTRAPLANG